MKTRMYRTAIAGSSLVLLLQALGAGLKWGG